MVGRERGEKMGLGTYGTRDFSFRVCERGVRDIYEWKMIVCGGDGHWE